MSTAETTLAPLPLASVRPAIVQPALRTSRRLADYVALAKVRLSLLVLFTVAVGFVLASGPSLDLVLLAHTLLGTALVAFGASALNQVWERDVDARMKRTASRPLPAGRLSASEALRFGALSAAGGLVYLTLAVNSLTGFLGAVTLLSYVLAYTPLKRVTAFNTFIGAIPGALPPVMGWAAARDTLGVESAGLFLIVFLWQFPHFWAIAWMYRDDYARAGLRMIPVEDQEGGRLTGRLMVRHCVILVPASLGPYFLGLCGPYYLAGAVFLGVVFLTFGFRFLLTPSRERARHMLWASLAYLPLVLTLMLVDGPYRGAPL